MKILFGSIVVVILGWIGFGYVASKVKEPAYTVLAKKDGYEIREYQPYIEARVTVEGDYREALSAGFRILAGYIFGGNTSKQSIAMTVPVSEQQSEKIAMTAPVSETLTTGTTRVVSFVMPEGYTLDTLPTPNDTKIELVEVPAHKSAVLRYSGNTNADIVEEQKNRLLQYLVRDGVVYSGAPRSAGYNPPATPPFMKRNEIIIEVY